MDSPETAGSLNEARDIAAPEWVQYVGPWYVGDDDDIPDSITIDLYPEPAGAGEDLFIWLSETTQQRDLPNNYYGIRKYCTELAISNL